MNEHELKIAIEATLLAAGRPVTTQQLLDLFDERERPTKEQLQAALEQLANDYNDRGIELAEVAQRAVERTEALEVVTPAQLGILTFAPRDGDAGAITDRVVADGYAAPSSTVLRGRTVLRMCTINPRTTDEDVERTIAAIAQLA